VGQSRTTPPMSTTKKSHPRQRRRHRDRKSPSRRRPARAPRRRAVECRARILVPPRKVPVDHGCRAGDETGPKRISLTAQAKSLRLPAKSKRDHRHVGYCRRHDGTAATLTIVFRPHIFELSNRAHRAVPRLLNTQIARGHHPGRQRTILLSPGWAVLTSPSTSRRYWRPSRAKGRWARRRHP
jgi:hypothetical protein